MEAPVMSQMIDRYVQAWNAHDLDGVMQNYVDHGSDDKVADVNPLVGHTTFQDDRSMRQFFERLTAAYPNGERTTDCTFVAGDHVVMMWTFKGTNTGSVMETNEAPTSQHVEAHFCSVLDIRNGKIMRETVYYDSPDLLRQLGVISAVEKVAVE